MTPLDKDSARAHFRKLRQDLPETDRRAAAEQLASHVMAGLEAAGAERGSTVACYLSTGAEPSTELLLPALTRAGYRVVVPVCEPEYQLSWVQWYDGVELVRSPRAWVYEPVGERLPSAIMADVPLILLPGLAVDADGNRIGQGGGYYDRFLASVARLPEQPKEVGVFYPHEVVAPGSFEVTELDAPLDGAVTAEGWIWFGPGTV